MSFVASGVVTKGTTDHNELDFVGIVASLNELGQTGLNLGGRIKVKAFGPGSGRFIGKIAFGHAQFKRAKSTLPRTNKGFGHHRKGSDARECADCTGSQIFLYLRGARLGAGLDCLAVGR